MDDVAAFLRATAPFDLLDPDDLAAVAERADVRRASAGETASVRDASTCGLRSMARDARKRSRASPRPA